MHRGPKLVTEFEIDRCTVSPFGSDIGIDILTWGDIRFGEKQGQVLISRGKGNKARSIPLNTSARTVLAGYVAPLLQAEPTLKAVARAWSSHPTGPLWLSQKGGQLSVSAIGRVIDELVSACKGLP